MGYLVLALVGFACGALAMFFGLDSKRKRIEESKRRLDADTLLSQQQSEELINHQRQLNEKIDHLNSVRLEFEKRVISYDELKGENGTLKRDLRNIAINLHKLELDRDLQHQSQATIAER